MFGFIHRGEATGATIGAGVGLILSAAFQVGYVTAGMLTFGFIALFGAVGSIVLVVNDGGDQADDEYRALPARSVKPDMVTDDDV